MLAAAALVAAAGPARATYPGANGRLAFGMTVGGSAQPNVYSVLPDGAGLKQLTDDPAFDACPAYSADGKWIAYCSGAGNPPGHSAPQAQPRSAAGNPGEGRRA